MEDGCPDDVLHAADAIGRLATVGGMAHEFLRGVHLRRTEENTDETDALAGLLGGRAGLAAVLADLNRQGRRAWSGWGRAVERAVTWDRADRRDPDWWPQGISSSADCGRDVEGGRRVLVVSWYSKSGRGARLTFLDLDTLRYRHVLLVVPSFDRGRLRLAPLTVHAGGVVWAGPYLHVAATARGIVSCRPDDVLRVPDGLGRPGVAALSADPTGVATHGYRYVLPVRFRYTAHALEGHERLRYSFLSLDRSQPEQPALVAGEYGRGRQSTRLARFPLDPESFHLVTGDDGFSRPVAVDEGGVVQMQGAVVVGGRHYVTTSHGPWTPGSVWSGRPGELRRHRWATPIGPEDLTWWPSTDTLWTVTEHPRRRWVVAMPRSRFG